MTFKVGDKVYAKAPDGAVHCCVVKAVKKDEEGAETCSLETENHKHAFNAPASEVSDENNPPRSNRPSNKGYIPPAPTDEDLEEEGISGPEDE